MSSDERSYLGYKGYTIYKESLDVNDMTFIKKTLNVAPYIPKSPVQPDSFTVYLEGATKMYLPRYFGIKHFGEPDAYKISDGDKIDVPFNGVMRDVQKPIVDAYINAIDLAKGGGGLLDVPCGWGKTLMALYIIHLLKVKTLVIVHKGFLVNQWEERIREFLPTARIGKIQGQILDIGNKDIVIGMLQSLSMKDYPDKMFESFGMTIVDECHHISSEVFSRSLTRIITKFTLGLSATMNRKDGLTDVFKMFLGEVVYAVEREKEDNVLVKSIKYISNDPEFEELVLDYKGNPQYSSMITKICAYDARSEFIINVLKKEMAEYADQQFLVLGQNKSILLYIHDAIKQRNIASIGYYVGGMKEKSLKESESKQIIVATYSMAAEGLDIPSLTTLILVTPRTDIVQAVGRILRVKRDRPLVIDIVDTHDLFVRQWKKRATFYRKNNYSIKESDSINYFKNIWKEKNSKKIVEHKKCLIKIKDPV